MSGQLVGEVLDAAEHGHLDGLSRPAAAALLAIAERCRADTRQGSVRFGRIQAAVHVLAGRRSRRTAERAIADLKDRGLVQVISRGYKTRDGELHAPVYRLADIVAALDGDELASATQTAPPADSDRAHATPPADSASATPEDLASAKSGLASAKSALASAISGLASATAPPLTSDAKTYDGVNDGVNDGVMTGGGPGAGWIDEPRCAEHANTPIPPNVIAANAPANNKNPKPPAHQPPTHSSPRSRHSKTTPHPTGTVAVNRNELIDILTAVAAGDHRTIGPIDIDFWAAVIGDLPKDLAMPVIEHRREEPGVWLEPGHIYQRVRAIRQDLFQRQPLEDIEAHNDRIDEQLAPLIFELAEARTVDRALKQYHRPRFNPLTVPCAYCHASVGRPCTSGSVTMRGCHPSRLEAASPPKPPEDTAWPTCTACGKNPLVTDEDRARGVCTPCQQASTPQQPETKAAERNNA